jgi:hypothetical protein
MCVALLQGAVAALEAGVAAGVALAGAGEGEASADAVSHVASVGHAAGLVGLVRASQYASQHAAAELAVVLGPDSLALRGMLCGPSLYSGTGNALGKAASAAEASPVWLRYSSSGVHYGHVAHAATVCISYSP